MSVRRWLDWEPGPTGPEIPVDPLRAGTRKTDKKEFRRFRGQGVGHGPEIPGSGSGDGNPQPLEPGAYNAGSEGRTCAESPEIEAGPDSAELAHARGALNRAGVRIIDLEGATTIGIWSDLDWPEIRAALRSIGWERVPVRYLDGPGIPTCYKLRRVEGEPVPMSVVAEMSRHPAEPWTVRDRMLNEMGWRSKGLSWAKWQATKLKRIFREQGAKRKEGDIAAGTSRLW